MFNELNIKGNLTANKIIELLGHDAKDWEINYSSIEGNRTNKVLYNAYLKILELEGYDTKDLLKVKSNKDEVELEDIEISATEIQDMVKRIFQSLGINTGILEFDAELVGKAFEQQLSYQLWHLLLSYEGDNSASGNEKLFELLNRKFGFKKEHAQILANIALEDDYGSLSAKAIRKIYPYVKELHFDKPCLSASIFKLNIDAVGSTTSSGIFPPAAFTKPSIFPNFKMMVCLGFSNETSSKTSATTPIALSPFVLISSALCWAISAFLPKIATLTPASAIDFTKDAPKTPVPPVTTFTFPAKENCFSTLIKILII